jgi:hypothetical protein
MAIAKPLPEGAYICEFGYVHDYSANPETIAAFEEAEQLLHDPTAKTYSNFAELLAEIEAEIEAEDNENPQDEGI